jgi:hypothetical protein
MDMREQNRDSENERQYQKDVSFNRFFPKNERHKKWHARVAREEKPGLKIEIRIYGVHKS